MEQLTTKRYHNLLQAIEAERAGEEAYYRSLTIKKKLADRVESGIAWYPVQINKKHYTIGELIEIEVERTKHQGMPHKLRTGAGCDVFVNGASTGLSDNTGSTRYKGVISYLKRDRMGIILHSSVFDKSNIPDSGLLGVELVYDERPYRVMKETIEKVLASTDASVVELRDGLAISGSFEGKHRNAGEKYSIPPELNASQQEAIRTALQAEHVAVIHGPPGTGKTTTVCGLVQTLTQRERQVLVCAPSNNAVDLLAYRLDQLGLRVLRIGNVSRIGDSIAHLSVEEQASNHKDWAHIKKIKIEAEEARRQAGTYKRNFGKTQARNRHELYKESRELRKWAKDLEQRLTEQIVDNAQVICTTLIGAGHSLLDGIRVETVIIDEASQATEPECWNAILRAHRVVLAGDHQQLPPTVKSADAIKHGLAKTLLDQLSASCRYTHHLAVQYRMNNQILAFPNQQFYNGTLLSHESNGTHKITENDTVLSWIDTCGCSFDEQQHSENNSRWNEGEYFILREHLLQYEGSLSSRSIGVIAPYSEQVRYIRQQLDEEAALVGLNIEVNSIDGFQGQEKDVIYLSLVRSNESGEIGFLKDVRRLNVALTRAKMKLIIIGDSATICTHPVYSALLDHIETKATYQSAWEYMS